MSNNDEEYRTRRESHYNRQRSSLRSDLSSRSSHLLSLRSENPDLDYRLPSDIVNFDELEAPAPAPAEKPREGMVPRKKNVEDTRRVSSRGSGSKLGSTLAEGSVRQQRSKDDVFKDEDSIPDGFQNRNEVDNQAPVENPNEGRFYRHQDDAFKGEDSIPTNFQNLDELDNQAPVENPNEGRFYRHQDLEELRVRPRGSQFSTRSYQKSPLSRRNTNPDLTALPTIPDHGPSQEESRDKIEPWEDRKEPKQTPKEPHVSRFAIEWYTFSYLTLFSILGTLARLGVQWLTFYPGAPVVFSVLWANFAGSLVMGFLAEDRHLFRDERDRNISKARSVKGDEEKAVDLQAAKEAQMKLKKTVPLYIGLATGFCGSFTSFSSFIRDIFFALENGLPTPVNHPYSGAYPSTSSTVVRNGGYSFMAVLAVIILTLALCHSALKVGAHIAIAFEPVIPTLPPRLLRKFVDRAVVVTGLGAWLGAIFMAIWPPDRPFGPQSKGVWSNETWRGQAIFACVFAPIGCLLRFYISLMLNGLIASFPLGTFCVNIFGTAVLGMAFDLQHVGLGDSGLVGGGRVSCQVLQGIMDGFCGCLTTVSTWMLELSGLRRRHAYVYGGTSVLVALGVLVGVMGSVRWTVGFREGDCGS
ncbi:hypothetical protein GQ43DRAFT_484494 [Delitschia confertaspora ATCC 74209]|uniref:CrcB-like protein n=1 Tax=Delitschia confertaspora ATCC 74209 TaxID=1513339 RepID=A0A9P4MUE7_9PLEO|nr:hypothetical protein GQ43DRAFT_484494 [Delitschia confertaspora ATCC 74209]